MTYTQILGDVKFLITGSTSGTLDYSVGDIALNVNRHYDDVVSKILRADGRWEWDDDNYATLPVATTNVVADQADYNIASDDFLNLNRLEIKDSSGTWTFLYPISYEDKKGVAMTEWAKTNGTPQYYDKVGNSVILYPTPNYSSTSGLKSYYQRVASYFTSDDTTKEPGFSPLFHRLLSIGAAIDYCVANGLNNKLAVLTNQKITMENALIEYYSSRSKDEQPKIKLYKESYGVDEDYEDGSIGPNS
jgi:hypothetical protein